MRSNLRHSLIKNFGFGIFDVRHVAATVIVLFSHGGALADFTLFEGDYSDDWISSGINSNWSNGFPTADLDVIIEHGGTAKIRLGELYYTRDLYIRLSSANEMFAGSLFSRNVYLGGDPFVIFPGFGAATVWDGLWQVDGDLYVGFNGPGKLSIFEAGRVLSARGLVGDYSGASGTVEVGANGGFSGGVSWGAKWEVLGDLYVGNAGSGVLRIKDGGEVKSAFHLPGATAAIGRLLGSRGDVTVEGPGANWTHDGAMIVGSAGTGELSIALGGVVRDNGAIIGQLLGSAGAATISGQGSAWNNASELYVGREGAGELTVQNGGSVTSDFSFIGDFSSSSGAVTVEGPAAKWSNTVLYVGNAGVGELNIRNGGTVTTTALGTAGAVVGRLPNSTGAVTVDGAASKWTLSWQLRVGGNGVGTLRVTNGGKVSVIDDAYAGHAAGSSGTISVEGPGSKFTSNAIYAGYDNESTGLLSVSRGGGVVTRAGFIGHLAGASGAAIVDGFGSKWTNDTNLYVGDAGTGTLTIQNGGTVVNDGSISVGAAGTINVNGATLRSASMLNRGRVALSGGVINVYGNIVNWTGSAAHGVNISGNADVTFWGNVTNVAGSLFRVSDGSTVTFAGGFNGLDLTGPGDVVLEGQIAPGASPGTASFGGDVTFGTSAALAIELGGIAPGSQYDRLQAAGSLALNGALNVSLINGFVPTAGQSFDILAWGTLSGAFSAIKLPTLSGLMWDTTQMYITGVLSVVPATGLAGDYNQNGTVDAADYTLWRDTLGRTGLGLAADGNANNQIDAGDYDVWKSNFGNHSGSGAGTNTAVPEPATLVLLILATVGRCLLRLRAA